LHLPNRDCPERVSAWREHAGWESLTGGYDLVWPVSHQCDKINSIRMAISAPGANMPSPWFTHRFIRSVSNHTATPSIRTLNRPLGRICIE